MTSPLAGVVAAAPRPVLRAKERARRIAATGKRKRSPSDQSTATGGRRLPGRVGGVDSAGAGREQVGRGRLPCDEGRSEITRACRCSSERGRVEVAW